MPLVRISLMRGKPAGFPQKVGAIVYRTMADIIKVPSGDSFQIIAEHDTEHLVYDPAYLAISRTDGVVSIQTTLNECRAGSLKELFHRTLAERLHRDLGVRMDDVFVSLVEVRKKRTGRSGMVWRKTRSRHRSREAASGHAKRRRERGDGETGKKIASTPRTRAGGTTRRSLCRDTQGSVRAARRFAAT